MHEYSSRKNSPAFSCLGSGYQKLVVTSQRIVLAEFTKEEAVRAHLLQFASLYAFGPSYKFDRNEKLLKESARNFFNFLSTYLWNIWPKLVVTGLKKVKRIPPKVKSLWTEISSD